MSMVVNDALALEPSAPLLGITRSPRETKTGM